MERRVEALPGLACLGCGQEIDVVQLHPRHGLARHLTLCLACHGSLFRRLLSAFLVFRMG